jgi:hypothetical protein
MQLSVERAQYKITPEKTLPDTHRTCTYILLKEGQLFTAKDRENMLNMKYCIHKRNYTTFVHYRMRFDKAKLLSKIVTEFSLHGYEAHFFSHKFPDGSILWFCNLQKIRDIHLISPFLNSIQDKIQETKKFDKQGHYVFIAKDGSELKNIDNTSVNVGVEELTEEEIDRILYG